MAFTLLKNPSIQRLTASRIQEAKLVEVDVNVVTPSTGNGRTRSIKVGNEGSPASIQAGDKEDDDDVCILAGDGGSHTNSNILAADEGSRTNNNILAGDEGSLTNIILAGDGRSHRQYTDYGSTNSTLI